MKNVLWYTENQDSKYFWNKCNFKDQSKLKKKIENNTSEICKILMVCVIAHVELYTIFPFCLYLSRLLKKAFTICIVKVILGLPWQSSG